MKIKKHPYLEKIEKIEVRLGYPHFPELLRHDTSETYYLPLVFFVPPELVHKNLDKTKLELACDDIAIEATKILSEIIGRTNFRREADTEEEK